MISTGSGYVDFEESNFYSLSSNKYFMSSSTTLTFTLFPMSLYFDLSDIVVGHLNGDSRDELRGSKAKIRNSSPGEKYRNLRGYKILTASRSPRDWASRNKLNVVVVYRIGTINLGLRGRVLVKRRTSSPSFSCRMEPALSTSCV